ncbi:MAG: tetratricopeptide repeat protein, partial [Cyanobacteriota bacterium]|nr:tetratricopeptide repeat protein [Cyanobacteriota bacterium]
EKICRIILAEKPQDFQVLHLLAVLENLAGRNEVAIQLLNQVITLRPNSSQGYSNLAKVMKKEGRLEEAIAHYQTAISLEPSDSSNYSKLGFIFRQQRNLTASTSHYIEAIKLEPNNPDAHFSLAITLLLSGNLKEGFQEYHWWWHRWETKKSMSLVQLEKLWDGSNLECKIILLHAEQGYGDTIQFIRYLPLVKKQGGQIILACQKPLIRLLEKIPEIEQCVDIKVNSIAFDVHAPLLELPRIFGTTLDNIPPPIQNLNISHTKLIKLEYPAGFFLKVGIVWKTNPHNPTTTQRSCKLTDFQPLLDMAGVTFYSLQKEPGLDIQLLETLPILDLSNRLNDFADTAGIITQLDLVITVDTAVGHLAGTLGKPVWILLPFVPDWRWMLDRNDSPWYPTARLFRQPKIGDWDSVFIQVKQALIEFQESQHNLPANFDQAYQYYQENNLVEAERICRLILAEKPQYFQALHLLAVLEHLAGRNEVAIQLLNQVITLRPNSSQAYSNLGNILRDEGRIEEAIEYYQKAISLEPNDSSNYSKLGNILKNEGRLEEALAHYQKAISLEPNDSSNYSNLGFIFLQKKQIESAIANYEKSLFLDPSNPKTNFNLGVAWQNQGDLSKSGTYYQQAISLQPDYAQAYNNLGFIFQEQGNFTASIASYQKAIELEPHFPTSHLNLSLILLLTGDFKSGFQEYHWRWESEKCLFFILQEKLWDGSNLECKIILLHAEQGYGDTIQFIRYIPLVKQHGGRIILACHKPLIRLLEKIPEIEQCVDRQKILPTFDVHAPLLELPRILGTTLDTIPAEIPDLTVPTTDYIKLESTDKNLLKIGIFWSTNSISSTISKRSVSLVNFSNFLDIPGTAFYSLQKYLSETDIELLKKFLIFDLSSQLNDFADTAGIITQLDLIITIDTAVAHLAGTLGKPVWILLPFVPDWRWLLDRNDSPWYPTARLFRQPKINDWDSVFIQVKQALIEFMESQKKLGEKFNLAYQYYQQNNLVEAERICRLILAEKPQDFQVLHLLAVLENLAGRNEVAIQLLNQVITLCPKDSQAYLNLGKIFRDKGNLETAIEYYQKSLELNPSYIGIYNELGSIFFTLGKFLQSQKYYEEALKLDKSYVNAHFGIAGILLKQGNFIPGFSKYEWRWKTKGFVIRNFSQPVWDGSSFPGKTLLV